MDGVDGRDTARAVRSRWSAEQLPIIFVSANLMDNPKDWLGALDCQALVAKPVMESELQFALLQALKLEWAHEPPLANPQERTSPAPTTHAPLPAALREELQRLARLGQAAELRRRLRLAQTHEPTHAIALAHLQICVDRFDFDELMVLLSEDTEAEDDAA
jgi:CheY-like chemotaxis protein